MKAPGLEIQDWGKIEYQKALDRQLEMVKARQQTQIPDTLIFCTHPPVVTLGRGTLSSDIFGWQGSTIEVSRGGRATYHGPSQEVVYPILDLNEARANLPPRDLYAYMNLLERAVVETVGFFGIVASGSKIQAEKMAESLKSEHSPIEKAPGPADFPVAPKTPSLTGVWVGQKKIASVGIAVSRWVSYHGVAINVDYDPNAFQGLNPCGFSASTMISMEQLIEQKIDRADLRKVLSSTLVNLLSKN